MTNKNYITADTAAKMTYNTNNANIEKSLNKIFDVGIYPAIKEGNYKCSVHADTPFPEKILHELRNLGYKVEYGSHYDQRDGRYDDLTTININWVN